MGMGECDVVLYLAQNYMGYEGKSLRNLTTKKILTMGGALAYT